MTMLLENPVKKRRVTCAEQEVVHLLCSEDFEDELPRKCEQSSTASAAAIEPAIEPASESTWNPSVLPPLPDDALAYLEQDDHEELAKLALAQAHPAAIIPSYPSVVQQWKRQDHRPILVEHLIDVGSLFRYDTETVALAVSYLDRYLSAVRVDPFCLDALSAACLLVAAKFNETWSPKRLVPSFLREFGVSRPLLLQFELRILKLLGWHVNVVTPHHVLHRLLRLAPADLRPDLLRRAELLVDMALSDTHSLKYTPFTIAVASLVAAASQINVSSQVESFLHVSQLPVEPSEVSDTVKLMTVLFDVARSSYSPTFVAGANEFFDPIEPA